MKPGVERLSPHLKTTAILRNLRTEVIPLFELSEDG